MNLAFIQKKLVNSLFFALEVAKKMNARVATLPDLISLRTNNDPEQSLVWNRWLTPFTTLYFGKYKDKRIIVVAHHLGPLSTKKRLLKWTKSGIKNDDSTREKYGSDGLPKITNEEFCNLVEGKYGPVTIIDFAEYYAKFANHLSYGYIVADEICADPLFQALMGKDMELFINKCLQISTTRALKRDKEKGAESKILQFNIKDQYGWGLSEEKGFDFPDKQPIGLFINFGCLTNYSNRDLSVLTEIETIGDLDYARFVVLTNDQTDIIDIDCAAKKHWKKCLVNFDGDVPDIFVLEKFNEKYFTQYPKEGARMDTGEIMFEVIKAQKIGKETFFQTKIDYSPFLKYDINEVKAIAPKDANAYIITDNISPGDIVDVPVQFFKVEVNTKKRILHNEEIADNLSLLLKINNIKVK